MSISKFSAARLFSRVLLLCAASTVALASVDANDAQNWPDRLNPKVVGINNLAPRSIFAATAYEQHTLNGDWKFQLALTPNDVPFNFEAEDFADVDWDTIPVPSNFQTQGYGYPVYTNIPYPWPAPWNPKTTGQVSIAANSTSAPATSLKAKRSSFTSTASNPAITST